MEYNLSHDGTVPFMTKDALDTAKSDSFKHIPRFSAKTYNTNAHRPRQHLLTSPATHNKEVRYVRCLIAGRGAHYLFSTLKTNNGPLGSSRRMTTTPHRARGEEIMFSI